MQGTARDILAAVIVLLIAPLPGCALRPAKIAPAPISPAAYAQADCRQLAQMRARTDRTLILAEIAQYQRYQDDRTRTFGVPTPMATIFEGGGEAQVARLKGDSLALGAQLHRAECLRDQP
jgi:hypothetical protein